MSACCQNGTCDACVAAIRAHESAALERNGKAPAVPTASPAPRKHFYALGHRIPLEHGLLALWKNRDARAALIAVTARRIGHLTDLQLRLRLFAIFVFGNANDVVLELVGLEAERERVMRARAAS